MSDNLDGLIDLEASVRAAGANPTAWVLAPATWAEIRKLKNADTSNVNLLGAGTSDPEPRLLGIPVTVNPAISAGKGLLIDASTILTAVGPVTTAVDEGTYFTTDSIAIPAGGRHRAREPSLPPHPEASTGSWCRTGRQAHPSAVSSKVARVSPVSQGSAPSPLFTVGITQRRAAEPAR
ncbi:phage major capsid protein [Gordonia sp. (in: high G+C Gram-positive bacteria)]|uniref:phage major capsid protein n=1 Tax=Gordonia sp. (in: high G+C Gram-positive bacteria) TaxID=84139 RepID=UPI003458134D